MSFKNKAVYNTKWYPKSINNLMNENATYPGCRIKENYTYKIDSVSTHSDGPISHRDCMILYETHWCYPTYISGTPKRLQDMEIHLS